MAAKTMSMTVTCVSSLLCMMVRQPCIVLYFTVLNYTELHCRVLYYTVLQCTVLYCTALYSTALYCTGLTCMTVRQPCTLILLMITRRSFTG